MKYSPESPWTVIRRPIEGFTFVPGIETQIEVAESSLPGMPVVWTFVRVLAEIVEVDYRPCARSIFGCCSDGSAQVSDSVCAQSEQVKPSTGLENAQSIQCSKDEDYYICLPCPYPVCESAAPKAHENKICDATCYPGCLCKQGLMRGPDGRCHTRDACPSPFRWKVSDFPPCPKECGTSAKTVTRTVECTAYPDYQLVDDSECWRTPKPNESKLCPPTPQCVTCEGLGTCEDCTRNGCRWSQQGQVGECLICPGTGCSTDTTQCALVDDEQIACSGKKSCETCLRRKRDCAWDSKQATCVSFSNCIVEECAFVQSQCPRRIPPQCSGDNEVPIDCKSAVCAFEPSCLQSIPGICEHYECQPDQCVCAAGFMRKDLSPKAPCINVADCAPLRCLENEIYVACRECTREKACDDLEPTTTCTSLDACTAGCVCRVGFLRLDSTIRSSPCVGVCPAQVCDMGDSCEACLALPGTCAWDAGSGTCKDISVCEPPGCSTTRDQCGLERCSQFATSCADCSGTLGCAWDAIRSTCQAQSYCLSPSVCAASPDNCAAVECSAALNCEMCTASKDCAWSSKQSACTLKKWCVDCTNDPASCSSYGPCRSSRFGCCPDGVTARVSPDARGCPVYGFSCGENEQATDCEHCPQPSCDQPDMSTDCIYESCKPGCRCAPGYYRSSSTACVRLQQCPIRPDQCRADEVFSQCGQCDTACDGTVVCGKGVQAGICEPNCGCPEGFRRMSKDPSSSCVEETSCPQNQCPPGQEMAECGQCGDIACDGAIVCQAGCKQGCRCSAGTKRLSTNNPRSLCVQVCPEVAWFQSG